MDLLNRFVAYSHFSKTKIFIRLFTSGTSWHVVDAPQKNLGL